MIRTSKVVPLGIKGSVDLTKVAGIPGGWVGRGATLATGATIEAGAETEGGGAVTTREGGFPSIVVRRQCGWGPAAATVISSLAPTGI